MDGVDQGKHGKGLASTEDDIDDCENAPTPTGSMNSINCDSLDLGLTSATFKNALSEQDEASLGSICSFKSLGAESLASFYSTRSFQSAKSHTDTEAGSIHNAATSLTSLGADSIGSCSTYSSFRSAKSQTDTDAGSIHNTRGSLRSSDTGSFRSCSTYASFKSAKSHTDNENGNDLTPTNSFRSFFGGSFDSLHSFKSARSGTTYTADEQRTLNGSIGSLESFSSFKTFASFKNARSDLSLSETITGDNDFASLHRFCVNSSLERGINHSKYLSETDDEEEENLLGSFNVAKIIKPPNVELSSHQSSIIHTDTNTVLIAPSSKATSFSPQSEDLSFQKLTANLSDLSNKESRISSSNSRLIKQ